MKIEYYTLPFLKNESVGRILKESIVKDFHANITSMNKSTAEQYLSRLNIFGIFLRKEFNDLTINDLVNKIKEGSIDPYSVLRRYCGYLKSGDNISLLLQ